MALNATQTKNGKTVLHAAAERAKRQHWDARQAHRVAVLCIQCALTESNLYVYASGRIPESLKLPYDDGHVGWDHYSVGVFQQQPTPYINGGGWGETADCQDPKRSAHKFMSALTERGMDRRGLRPANRLRIQAVQVSFDSGGWNYAANYLRARLFVARHWDMKAKRVKEGHK